MAAGRHYCAAWRRKQPTDDRTLKSNMAAILTLLILGVCAEIAEASNCQPGSPPRNGLLSCRQDGSTLVCHATCNDCYMFPNKEKVMTSKCDVNTGRWEGASTFEDCAIESCSCSLLSSSSPDTTMTASTVYLNRSDIFGPELARLSATRGIWRPDIEDVAQYVQVNFKSLHKITGVVTKGDGHDAHVSLYRMLFSMDGVTWFPYTDTVKDKFFQGNSDSSHNHTVSLPCPHIALYVRINPLTWHHHIALHLDLLGCPYIKQTVKPANGALCEPMLPPKHGMTSCEKQGQTVVCTFTCQRGFMFETNKLKKPVAIKRTCDMSVGLYDYGPVPRCVERGQSVSSNANITGFCIESLEDCDELGNGDYQFCGDCHFFCTCSEHIYYVRACPAQLKFDSKSHLCDFYSSTCKRTGRHAMLQNKTD
ncbi:uncharacterized protein LOC124132996 [Haliotis rufescens]|uniref:uncharacterized protein LOC124132996 n=1 Tax=Haliotis rufescens TaxID=6454 RepID=UPI00201F36C5|nr:uncharacterized protein LOC124132996 [Haliotis rufescens]